MAESYGYITFYRSKARFLYVFISFILLGGLIFGLADDFAKSFLLVLLSICLIVVFLYEFYLVSYPVVEIIDDSMTIRQIYDPLFKWRFVFQNHIIGFNAIMLMEVKLNKKNAASLLRIQYHDGTGIKKCYLRRSDVTDFDSVIKLIEAKLPGLTVNYVKS